MKDMKALQALGLAANNNVWVKCSICEKTASAAQEKGAMTGQTEPPDRDEPEAHRLLPPSYSLLLHTKKKKVELNIQDNIDLSTGLSFSVSWLIVRAVREGIDHVRPLVLMMQWPVK